MSRVFRHLRNPCSIQSILLIGMLCLGIHASLEVHAASIDSLKSALLSDDLSFEERMDLSIQLVGKTMNSDYSKALAMADSLYGLVDDYPVFKARIAMVKAHCLGGMGDADTALQVLEESFALCKLEDSPFYYSKFISLKGLLLARKGNVLESKEYFERAIHINDSIGAKGRLASAISDLAAVYGNLGRKQKSSELYFEALRTAEEAQDHGVMATCLSNIGIIYHQSQQLDTARLYYQKAYEQYEKSESLSGRIQMIRYIGVTYHAQGLLDTAKVLYERSLELAQLSGSIQDIIDSKIRLGELANRSRDFDESEKNFLEALELARSAKLKREEGNIYRLLGTINGEQGQFREAIRWCEKSYEIATNMESEKYELEACECLKMGYKSVGDFENAFEMQKRQIELINDQKKERALLSLQQQEYKYASLQDSLRSAEEKLKVEQDHQAEIRKKDNARNMALGGGVLVILLSIGLWSRLRYTRRTKAIIEKEKERSEELLLNILPEEVADELKEKGHSDARLIDHSTVLFTDFKGFTALAEGLSPKELVSDLNLCFSEFDRITGKYGIEKIKTIGDAYMAAGGLPSPDEEHAKNVVLAALDMAAFVQEGKKRKIEQGLPYFEVRIGIHTGPVVAGIVGVKKFQYDIWGDTVNTASRMESSGEVGKVNISQSTYELIKDDPDFVFEKRGKIEAKGKGEMEMWFVAKK